MIRSGRGSGSSRRRAGWGTARSRGLALVAAAALIPLAGCEAGNNAPTVDFHYPTDTGGTVVGDLSIRNVFVLGAPLGSTLVKGQSASLFLAIVNSGTSPDRLLAVSAPGSAASVSMPSVSIPIVLGHPVLLSGPAPSLVLTGLTRDIRSGSNLKIVLTFLKAGRVSLIVPVMPRASHYTTYSPPPPSPSASPGAARHKAHASPAASSSPSATAGSPSPTSS